MDQEFISLAGRPGGSGGVGGRSVLGRCRRKNCNSFIRDCGHVQPSQAFIDRILALAEGGADAEPTERPDAVEGADVMETGVALVSAETAGGKTAKRKRGHHDSLQSLPSASSAPPTAPEPKPKKVPIPIVCFLKD